MHLKNSYSIILLLVFFVHLGCQNNVKKNVEKTDLNEEGINHPDQNEVKKQQKTVSLEEVYKKTLDSLKAAYEPPKITQEEFENFKMKSNYIQVITDYRDQLFRTYFSYLEKKEKFRPYTVPTEVNTKEYLSNSFVFGDLNNDGRSDCVVTSLCSDMYNEIHFFYVFINDGKKFKLMDVVSEDDLAGCKNGGWPSIFRYQKIEDGFFKGITFCHWKDAHCCASLVFKAKAAYVNNQLQFHSAEFVADDPYIMKYRPTPTLDSVLVKSNIN